MDGLKEGFQEWVVPQRPDSLEDAFRLALSWEQAKRTRKEKVEREVKCGFCEGMHEEDSCDVRRGMRELWLRSKERAQRFRVVAPGSPGGLRSFSMSERMGREEEDRKDDEAARKSPCQCWKHECWKKSDKNTAGAIVEVNPSQSMD